MTTRHHPRCASFDFDPEKQLGSDKACDCTRSCWQVDVVCVAALPHAEVASIFVITETFEQAHDRAKEILAGHMDTNDLTFSGRPFSVHVDPESFLQKRQP